MIDIYAEYFSKTDKKHWPDKPNTVFKLLLNNKKYSYNTVKQAVQQSKSLVSLTWLISINCADKDFDTA